jgi:ABC-2 type transport system permease protein
MAMEEPTTARVIPERDGPDRSEAAVRFGIASAARDVGISVGVVLGLLYLFPVLVRVMSSPRWNGGPPHGAPITAGLKLRAGAGLGSLTIGAWVGPGLLVGLAVSALVVGGLLLRFCNA